jgi:hypothetical protein
MKALASRKQMLIAESELNRAYLLHELDTLAGEVQALADQAKTVGLIASAVTTLVVGLSAFRDRKSEPVAGRPSWWRTLLKGAGLLSSLWSKFHT